MKWDWDWTSVATVALAVATVILAGATFRTLHFLKKAQIDQAEALGNQRISLEKQTEAVKAHTDALKAQTKALRISAEHFATNELLAMNRWLAENPHLQMALENSEDEYSYDGENAAAVLSGFMDQTLRHCRLMELGDGKLWMPYFEDKLRQYPQVRKRINLCPDWYSEETLKKLAKDVSESVGIRSCPPLQPRTSVLDPATPP